MTAKESPVVTDLSPPVKSPSANKTPDVPLEALVTNAPAIVAEPVMVKDVAPVPTVTDGVAVVGVPKPIDLRPPE